MGAPCATRTGGAVCRYDEWAPRTEAGWQALALVVGGVDVLRWVNGHPVGVDPAAVSSVVQASGAPSRELWELVAAAGVGIVRAWAARAERSAPRSAGSVEGGV